MKKHSFPTYLESYSKAIESVNYWNNKKCTSVVKVSQSEKQVLVVSESSNKVLEVFHYYRLF